MSVLILQDPGYRKYEKIALSRAWELIDKVPKENRYRHVALVMSKDFLVSWAVNFERRNHNEAISYFRNAIHAEWSALIKFRRTFSIKRLNECDLYSIRFLRNGTVSLAKPCEVCADFIRKHPLRRTLYTGMDGLFHNFT